MNRKTPKKLMLRALAERMLSATLDGIAQTLDKHRMTDSEFARRLGVPRQSVHRWLRARTSPPPAWFVALGTQIPLQPQSHHAQR